MVRRCDERAIEGSSIASDSLQWSVLRHGSGGGQESTKVGRPREFRQSVRRRIGCIRNPVTMGFVRAGGCEPSLAPSSKVTRAQETRRLGGAWSGSLALLELLCRAPGARATIQRASSSMFVSSTGDIRRARPRRSPGRPALLREPPQSPSRSDSSGRYRCRNMSSTKNPTSSRAGLVRSALLPPWLARRDRAWE